MKKIIAVLISGTFGVFCFWCYTQALTYIPRKLGIPKEWENMSFTQQMVLLVLVLTLAVVFTKMIPLIYRLYEGLTKTNRRFKSKKQEESTNPTALFIQNENL